MDTFGIYKIINKNNGKFYIGSTSQSFRKRWNLHRHQLNNDKHKNSHLQYSWNKYGAENFEFIIIEKCEDRNNVLNREQYYIDNEDFENLYNINPLATGGLQFSNESIRKRTETNSKRNKILSERYSLWKQGLLLDENLDDSEKHIFEIWSTRIPWNKGLKYDSTDHLKVPKLKKGNRSKDIETKRNKSEVIEIYNLDGKFLMDFRSAKDIEEYSLSRDCELNPKSRFKGDTRMGVPSKILKAFNIRSSCRNQKPYKGLIFKYKKETAHLVGDNEDCSG